MPLHNDTAASVRQTNIRQLRTSPRIPSCPHCGERLLAPEQSQFHGGEILHFWSCEDCGGEVRTAIPLVTH